VVPQSAVLLQTSPQMSQGWLCFESDGDKWRLTGPPENWATLADAELLGLMSRAAAVKKTSPKVEQVG
jgi:hypothetical protein